MGLGFDVEAAGVAAARNSWGFALGCLGSVLLGSKSALGTFGDRGRAIVVFCLETNSRFIGRYRSYLGHLVGSDVVRRGALRRYTRGVGRNGLR